MTALDAAIQNHIFDNIGLSVDPSAISLLNFFDEQQSQLGVKGNIVEVGVAQGCFFIPLLLCCRADEVGIAIDVFEEQVVNWNPAGGVSNTEDLYRAAELAGVRSLVRLLKSDSLAVDSAQVTAAGGGSRVRLFSIDGAHSAHHTIHDLQLAERVITPGGVVFLDDVQNAGWPGVIDGFARYSLLQPAPGLVPFYLALNKVLLTTPSHHPQMLEAAVRYAERELGRIANQTYRLSRLFSWDIVGF